MKICDRNGLAKAKSLFLIISEYTNSYIRPCSLSKDKILEIFNDKTSDGFTMNGMCCEFEEPFNNLNDSEIKLKYAIAGIEPDFKIIDHFYRDGAYISEYYDFTTNEQIIPPWHKTR